jgi:isoleucyl-tRNA synthetase
MVELNQEITWVPEHVKDGQFGKWLEGARDWSISRNRFWGSRSRCGAATTRPTRASTSTAPRRDRARLRRANEHRARPAPPVRRRPHPAQPRRPDRPLDDAPRRGGARLLVRVGQHALRPGALPVREPDWFEQHFPGDFIVEYIGQTRGWFYTLHVLSTALFDRPAFSNVRLPRHRARRRRPEDVQEAEATTPTRPRSSRPTAPTPCAGT